MKAKRLFLNEMAYPTSFNMEYFNSIPTYKGKVEYCKENLRKISSGSSRIVYKIDDEKVLKLAKNGKGIAQNSVESDPFYQQYEVCAKVFDVDYKDRWVEMELAYKIYKDDFKNILGISFEDFCQFVYWTKSTYSRPTSYKSYTNENVEIFNQLVNDNEWLQSFHYLLTDLQLDVVGDLTKLSSYGVVFRNGVRKIVIIDFGLTDDVYTSYYS